MRNPFIQSAILVALILAESTLLQDFGIAGVRPDLYLVLFLFFAYAQGSQGGVVIGFACGLVLDFISIAPLGMNAFSLSLLGFGMGSLRGKLFIDPVFMPFMLAFVAGLANALLARFLSGIFGGPGGSVLFSGGLFLQLGLNALIAPILFGLLKALGAIPQYLREEER